MAQEYFVIQQNLTAQISSPKDRRRSEAIDAAEREVYLDWRDQAFRTLGQAKLIMLDLHDMNVIITKAEPVSPLSRPSTRSSRRYHPR